MLQPATTTTNPEMKIIATTNKNIEKQQTTATERKRANFAVNMIDPVVDPELKKCSITRDKIFGSFTNA
jgi:hypothetical protein